MGKKMKEGEKEMSKQGNIAVALSVQGEFTQLALRPTYGASSTVCLVKMKSLHPEECEDQLKVFKQ